MERDQLSLEAILQQVKEGTLSVSEAQERLTSYEDLGFAKLDHHRAERTGFPEVVYGEGKTSDQLIQIIERLKRSLPRVLATRVDEPKAKSVLDRIPDVTYNPTARTLFWRKENEPLQLYDGYVAVVCAGTSDLPVAEEAAVTAEAFGCRVHRVTDVGVAGIHRLFDKLDGIRGASAVVSVAGMEGALTSVLAGLISSPIAAVPTSVGYGANFQGLSALLSMLNACAPGVAVVNIDNGFGAGYYAAQLHRLRYGEKEL
ncbi:MAG TPA: nickel pincer cofactor biosynthesis protein LarB [Bacillales bacterium]|nr:nickel pincer cofactor biosynthesis protein LarB [Bacillales bacterium]